jgi:alcohol dehydrogenase
VRSVSAQANLSKVPDDLTDEDILMCPDIGFCAAERARVRIGDAVAVFAQGRSSGIRPQ